MKNSRLPGRLFLTEIRKRSVCKKCGESDWRVLVFHHRCPKQKVLELCAEVAGRTAIYKLVQELAKCDVLCANCHMKIHCPRN